MLPNKSNKIFSEINDFFTSSEKAILSMKGIYQTLKCHGLDLGVKDFQQATYSKADVLLCLLLYPLFSIKNVRGYLASSLQEYMEAHKDVFYRFKNESRIKWRTLNYQVTARLLKNIEDKGSGDVYSPRCLIIDDSDLPKTGFKIEHISRIWSHVANKSICGFKGLFLGYWDGKSFFGLDFSLHKEKGKNKKYPYGLNYKQRKAQYSKKRDAKTAGGKRQKELRTNKIDNAMKMIKRALSKGISVNYVLMDSWFVCEKMIRFITELNAKVHLIGMAKMGKAKYIFQEKEQTAKEIVDRLRRGKKVKKVRKIGIYCAAATVTYKGIPVRLFFCKTTKRGKWHVLLTTNTAQNITEVFEIYTIRWGIEVFFKESKQYFGLGKSQSRDFDAQIADTTLSMIQYNIFSTAKRFSDYETIGALFAHAKDQMLELTICQRLWGFILELLQIVADIFDVDINELIQQIIQSEKQHNKIIRLIQNSTGMAA